MTKGGLFGVSILALTLGFSASALADPPPISAYAELQVGSPRMSPDGNAIAMMAPRGDRQALVVRQLDSTKTTIIPTSETFPDWFRWKSSTRLLASLRFTGDIGAPVAIGETRLIFIDADGQNPTLAKFNRTGPVGAAIYGNVGNRVPQNQDHVLSLLPDDPDHVLMAITPQNDWIHPEIVLTDIHNGHVSTVQRTVHNAVDFLADDKGVARAAIAIEESRWSEKHPQRIVMVRENAESDWQTINQAEFNHQQGKRLHALGFSPLTPNLLYVLSEGEGDRLVGRSYDIAAHSYGPVIAADPKCDANALMHDYQVAGFRLVCQTNKTIYLDPAWQRDWELVTRVLKAELVDVTDRSDDGKRTFLTVRKTPTAPMSFWLIDRRGAKTELREVGEDYEKVPEDQIAETKMVSFKARDGLEIPALLTLPVGSSGGVHPFVVLPHGGPTANDTIHFDWMVQFLASRGYGVLQPQFRGSTGFGAAFEEAGLAQWGLAMQDDITDGTRWLIDHKLADPKRICIVGASYGGYASLEGVVKEPGLYACAAAYAPVADIDLFLNRLKGFAFKDINLPRIKDDMHKADDISPSEHADRIQVPVLLMHGRKDFTVPVEQSEAMERAMRHAHKPVEVVYLDGADHYLGQGSDRMAWLTGLDKLLASTIGAGTAP
jgi:dienelactone hydrolase